MSAKKYATGDQLAKGGDSLFQALAIASCAAGSRRPKRTILTIRQIATQNRETLASKGFCQSYQKRRLAIGSRAVSEHETIAVRRRWLMKESADGRIKRATGKCSDGGIAHLKN